jgi:hypothetical protein
MKSPILVDAQAHPRLFRWNGPIDPQILLQWAARHDCMVPPDLLDFWASTGGGEVFETEMFLKPLVSSADEDGVEHATISRERRGMPAGLVVFHEGLGSTAVRCADGAYVSLDFDSRIAGLYDSFDDWYVNVLRSEYGERYRLAARRHGGIRRLRRPRADRGRSHRSGKRAARSPLELAPGPALERIVSFRAWNPAVPC